jgi:hypothetical protein
MSQKLQNNLANGYEFKLGEYISRGWEIFKANMGGYLGYFVLYLLILIFLNFIPFLGSIGSMILGPCLIFGFHLVSNQISQHNNIPAFSTFFNGFNHAGKLIVIALITFIIVLACLIPFFISFGVSIFSMIGKSGSDFFTPFIESGALPFLGLGMLVYLYFGISWIFAPMIAVFHNKEAWAAMEISRKLVGKNWFMFFLFAIVLGFIAVSGVLLIGFGLIFTVPLSYCCLYAAYEDLAGYAENSQNQIDEIGQIGSQIN